MPLARESTRVPRRIAHPSAVAIPQRRRRGSQRLQPSFRPARRRNDHFAPTSASPVKIWSGEGRRVSKRAGSSEGRFELLCAAVSSVDRARLGCVVGQVFARLRVLRLIPGRGETTCLDPDEAPSDPYGPLVACRDDPASPISPTLRIVASRVGCDADPPPPAPPPAAVDPSTGEPSSSGDDR